MALSLAIVSAPGWTEPRTREGADVDKTSNGAVASAELETLMERYQQADPEATKELVDRLSPMLLRFLAGPMQTRDQAEDMLQDCWMRIHRARHTYRPGAPLLPWVFAIARHARVDAYRKRSQITRRELISEDLRQLAPRASIRPRPIMPTCGNWFKNCLKVSRTW
ncbi:MAG: sigma factor [Bryobacterales bacterium]